MRGTFALAFLGHTVRSLGKPSPPSDPAPGCRVGSCRSLAATAHPSLLVLKRACTERPLLASGIRSTPLLRVAASTAAVDRGDGGGPSLCIASPQRPHRGRRLAAVATNTSATPPNSAPSMPCRVGQLHALSPLQPPARTPVRATARPKPLASRSPSSEGVQLVRPLRGACWTGQREDEGFDD